MLDDLKFIHERDSQDALEASEAFWQTGEWSATVPTSKNLAKQIALEVIGKTPIIYSGPLLAPAAAGWKYGFNLRAKQLAWTGQYPEVIEAELTGWTKQPTHKPFTVIDLRSSLDDTEVKKAFVVAERLLSGQRPAPITIHARGETIEDQTSWISALGEFTSIYTALLNGVNPSSNAFNEKFNERMEESHE